MVLAITYPRKEKDGLQRKKKNMALTLQRAKELGSTMVTEDHLIIHSLNVCYAMGAMARHFSADEEHWMAVGYLHDYDYEKFPEEHLQHTERNCSHRASIPKTSARSSATAGASAPTSNR